MGMTAGQVRMGISYAEVRRLYRCPPGSCQQQRSPCRFAPGSSFGNRLDRAHLRTGVSCPRADEAVVVELLDDVGAPAGHSRHDKDGRIKWDFESEGVVEPASGPIEVREEVFLLGQDAL